MSHTDIKMYGTAWCSDCKRAKKFFGEQRVHYDFVDVDGDPEGLAIVEKANNGKHIIPTLVFGDGSVLIKWAPGHTPGHQVLFVKLARTGPVLLSGDLYHYPEERTLDRVPTFDVDPALTRRTRTAIDAFVKRNRAQLWIQHDFKANAALKKGPGFYE